MGGLTKETWDSFLLYLLYERNISQTSKNLRVVKGYYLSLSTYLDTNNLAFNKDSFIKFLDYKRKGGAKDSYLNCYIKLAKNLDRFLKLNELTEMKYFKEKKKQIDILSPSDIKQIAEVYVPYLTDTSSRNYFYKALIYFLAMTGCRIGEALSLTWDNCKEEFVIFVDTKNGEDRIVPILPFLSNLLHNLPHNSDFVFDNMGRPIAEQTVNVELKRRAKLVGCRKVVYNHVFRHSFITEMIKSGVSIAHISRIVGHKDLESTNHYISLDIQELSFALYAHPLMREGIPFDKIVKRAKELVNNFLINTSYRVTIEEFGNELVIKIKNE